MAWLDVEAFDCCMCLYVCIASAFCDFLIPAVWRKLTNKGYNFGWMCTGVTSEFAGVKLSGSLKMYGSSGSGVAHSIEFFFMTT